MMLGIKMNSTFVQVKWEMGGLGSKADCEVGGFSCREDCMSRE